MDFDATEDPLHGNQEGAFFHGYYRHYCYLPLYCFCGNIALLAQLRDAKRDASSGTAEALKKITRAIRKRFGRRVRIIVRADSGFAREEIMAWCEDNALYYYLGLARNKRLSARLGKGFGELYRAIESAEIQVPCRRFEDFAYRTRKSWSRARRVVGKAEILDKGQNPRFVVTNLPAEGLPGEPQERLAAPALYEKLYCARGEMENRIKEAQQDLFADRTSTGWMASNELRLWFSAFAHLMVSVLRAQVLAGTDLASATLGQIRLKLFKIGARIKISCRRIHLELAMLILRGDFPARPGQSLRDARRLNLPKSHLSTQEKRADFKLTEDRAESSHSPRTRPAGPRLALPRADKPEKVPLPTNSGAQKSSREMSNEIACEQCGRLSQEGC